MDCLSDCSRPGSGFLTRRKFLACGMGCAAWGGFGFLHGEASEGPFPAWPSGPKEAGFYEKLRGSAVRCGVCPRTCIIPDGERGFCRTRENRNGTLYSLVYGKVAALQTDPVEKKPLFHFLPGARAFSIATAGCNFTCKFCQNHQLSQARPEDVNSRTMSPGDVVSGARSAGARVIAFTYNEPTVFTEYAVDVAAEAQRSGIRSVMVSNGFIRPAPLEKLAGVISAYKVDFKAFSRSFYRDVAGGDREPVLATIRSLHRLGVWTELVHLTIPTLNDRETDFHDMADWLLGEIGPYIPVHFTRFSPMYRLTSLPVTPVATLERARNIFLEKGMRFVYIGNVPGHPGGNTYCPGCGAVVIERVGNSVLRNSLRGNACDSCGNPIPGVWS